MLILSSLLLSGLLWYRYPNVEETGRDDYIPRQTIGEERQVEQLVRPRSVVLHDGSGHHLMAFPGDAVYEDVATSLPKWQLSDIENKVVTTEQWTALLREKTGWELRFPTSVPIPLLAERLLPELGDLREQQWVDRIWMYRERGKIRALFISDVENRVSESEVALEGGEAFPSPRIGGSFPVRPVTMRLLSANPYEPVKVAVTYVPARSFSFPVWQAPLQSVDLQKMKNVLFLDPSFVRTVSNEEEDVVIMQDGSRSVRYVKSSRMLYYQNFKHREAKKAGSDMVDAVAFVNEHGGWLADYYLVESDGLDSRHKGNRYTFRLLRDGLPVYSQKDNHPYDTLLTVESDDGHVSRYDRSLYYAGDGTKVGSKTLPGGEPVLEQLKEGVSLSTVRDLFPAYEVEKTDEALRLTPGWRIQFTDGKEAWLAPPKDGGK